MKLSTEQELSDFLVDFSQTIELLDTGKTLRVLTQAKTKLFVDPLVSGELRFLVQFYNDMARMNVEQVIDLDEIWKRRLQDAGLSGVDVDAIDANLLIFLRHYKLVESDGRTLAKEEQLRKNIAELKAVQQQLHEDHYFKKPAADLIALAECNDKETDEKPFKDKPMFTTFNSLNKMVTATRQLIAPKLGEKNCFSYNARAADYKTQARLNGLASFGNGLLGALSLIVSAAMFLASAAVFALIVKVSMGSVLIGLALPGAMLASTAAMFPATAVLALSLGLIQKADYQRNMCGAMFSMANANSDSARLEKSDDVPLVKMAYTS